MKKLPSASQMKLPTSGGSNKLPQKPMALPKASSVKEDMEKEQIIDENGGGGGGGAVDTADKEESNENAILPSHEDLKTFVEAWLARPENAQVSSTLLPTAKEKEEIMQGCGVDKKRLESLFYRMREKLKQRQKGLLPLLVLVMDQRPLMEEVLLLLQQCQLFLQQRLLLPHQLGGIQQQQQ